MVPLSNDDMVCQVPPADERAMSLFLQASVRPHRLSVMAVDICSNRQDWSPLVLFQTAHLSLVVLRKLPRTTVSFRRLSHSSGCANKPTKHEYRYYTTHS